MGNRNKLGQFAPNTNRWNLHDGIAECYLDGELLFFTDADVYEALKDYPMSKMADGYSAFRLNGVEIAVHRFISKPADNELVDHINRNKKDNRRSNLRNTDKSVNAFNSAIRSTNTSGTTGVYFRKDTGMWAAEIKKNYKKICLGCFGTKEEAVAARKKAEVVLYGN